MILFQLPFRTLYSNAPLRCLAAVKEPPAYRREVQLMHWQPRAARKSGWSSTSEPNRPFNSAGPRSKSWLYRHSSLLFTWNCGSSRQAGRSARLVG
jgi:hypothetical protein